MSSTPTRHRPQFAQRIRRVRQAVIGTAERPRMSIFIGNRSNRVQLIDDAVGRTLASASDLKRATQRGTVESATEVGTAIAAAAKALHITTVTVDRRGRRYHGRVQAMTEAAAAAGLII